MPIPALLAPLLSQGLSLIGNAVMAKGKDWVEEKTGVKLDQPLSAEDTLKLKQYEMDHEEELLRLRIEEKKLGIDELQAALTAANANTPVGTLQNSSQQLTRFLNTLVSIHNAPPKVSRTNSLAVSVSASPLRDHLFSIHK